MARQKSELKSAFGKGQEILFALLEGVEDAGGDDNDARRVVTDKQLRRQIAELLVSRPLTAHVNYDDPGHHAFNRDEYYYVEGGLSSADFPVRGQGEADVMYEYITFNHDPTTQEVLDEIEQRGNLRVPDFAETRDFHAQNPQERKKGWIVSLGGVVADREGCPGVASVGADGDGLGLDWRWLGGRWTRSSRFLAVRK